MRYLITIVLSTIICLSSSEKTALENREKVFTHVIPLNRNDWSIAIDPDNKGLRESWFKRPPDDESKKTDVPWVIQDIFRGYQGVAWYWKVFKVPENCHIDGRYIFKFSAVDYLADVWVNGVFLGRHEGSETPFELDGTGAIDHTRNNLLVVRVLNPTYEPIDGIVLKDTPSGGKQYPVECNSAYNSGGITGDVELFLVPSVRFHQIHLVPDWQTGKITIHASVINGQSGKISAVLSFKVSEERKGYPVAFHSFTEEINPGMNTIRTEIQIANYKLWCPDNPVLYRFEASCGLDSSVDENSFRFGFRDFRFAKGYFRLNGKRIFLHGSNFSTHFPAGFNVPLNEDMLRRDVINMKALGYNFVRIPFGCPNSRVLDLYDELGILVQMEHYGSWQMGQYGKHEIPGAENRSGLVADRFEKSIREVVLRDRNHASVVMWGMLNENKDDKIFRKAVELLPSLRKLDPLRIFILNSGRYDGVSESGSMSNPGSSAWDIYDHDIKDWHPYVGIPYTSESLDKLAGKQADPDQKVYISEAGLCFPVDLPAELGDYEQAGKENADDAMFFRQQ